MCLLCEGIAADDVEQCTSCGQQLVDGQRVHFPLRRGEDDASNPLLGTLIDGKYRVTGVLGKGGMGTVFRAQHEVSLVPVALKLLHPRFQRHADYRERFVAEARHAGRVAHEHCSRIFDVGEADDGTIYLAIELVEGETLEEWIHAEGQLAPEVVATILVQTARALAAAHAAGLVHRDLTPRNVMVQVRDGRPHSKILDFGIARLALEMTPLEGLGDEGLSFSNPPYSAPEHLAGEEVDARADLYSLGVLAYEMLSKRLPVEGRTRQELALATLESRRLPLRAPGAPTRLVRLVERLLQRDPARRPASAAAVARELERILQPQSALPRTAALLLSMAAMVLWTLALGARSRPYLQSSPSASLALKPSPSPEVPVQELQGLRLDGLVLEYGGFDASLLRAEATQQLGGEPRSNSQELHPEVDAARGLLRLTRTSSNYAGWLGMLASWSNDGPVDVTFRARDERLGFARLLLDDVPPRVRCAGQPLTGLADDALVAERRLVVDIVDRGTIAGRRLLVRLAGGRTLSRPLPSQREHRCGDLLRELLPGVADHGPVTCVAEAVDGAGNIGHGDELQFTVADLATPEIAAVRGARDEIALFGPEGARIALELSAAEPGLTVLVRAPDRREIALSPVAGENTNVLELRLPSRPGGGFDDGSYEFRLQDRAGNQSLPRSRSFEFRTADVAASLRAGDAEAGAAAVCGESLVVVRGGRAELGLRCNPIYLPVAASLARLEPTAAGEVTLADAVPGRARLRLHGLTPGRSTLRVEVAEREQAPATGIEYALVVLAGPVRLQLPGARRVRWLPALQEAGLLLEDEGVLRQGASWRLSPPESRLVHGRLWLGGAGAWQSLPVAVRDDGRLLPDWPLHPGNWTVALELYDVLQAPVDVWLGDEPAREIAPAPGVAAREVASFHWHPSAPESVEPETRIEYGQPVRLSLRTPLPLRADDEIALVIDDSPIAPTRIATSTSGCTLQFLLPFARIVAAAGLGHLQPGDYGKEHRGLLRAILRTPAGEYRQLGFALRTILSNLVPLRLAELAGDRQLPAPLAAIEMLPVVPAPGGTWSDPTVYDEARSRFRAGPALAVRNLEPYFLQTGELTRAQYAAIIAWLVEQPPAARRLLVHAADPKGESRAAAPGLLPHGIQNAADHVLWVAAGPDRPVTGVDFFQAFACTRALGALLAGDPDLLRLPTGIELEHAALADRQPGPRVELRGHRKAAPLLADAARWPPSAAESEQAGDVVSIGDAGWRLVGLDFGVREWVSDLPFLATPDHAALLREWLADHSRHLERCDALARGALGDAGFARALALHGVVRGLAVGELEGLVDAGTGRRVDPEQELVPARVPGVLRSLCIRRDGLGLLPGEVDPHLRLTGFRLAGGGRFVQKVRER
jgi:serine/threonine-protein kinase